MNNFGISQNFRAASINRKHARTNAQNSQKPETETIFESGDSSFVSSLSESAQESAPTKSKVNNINLQSMKINRTVIKSVDHH